MKNQIFFTNEWRAEKKRQKVHCKHITHWLGCTTLVTIPEGALEIHVSCMNFGMHITLFRRGKK